MCTTPLFNYVIDWIFDRSLQDYPGVQFRTIVRVPDLAYSNAIVLLSNNYTKMQVTHHAATFTMRINASKAKVMSALIPGEQRQAAQFDVKPFEDGDKFRYLSLIFIAKRPRCRRHQKMDLFCALCTLPPKPDFGCGLKYRGEERSGYTRQRGSRHPESVLIRYCPNPVSGIAQVLLIRYFPFRCPNHCIPESQVPNECVCKYGERRSQGLFSGREFSVL